VSINFGAFVDGAGVAAIFARHACRSKLGVAVSNAACDVTMLHRKGLSLGALEARSSSVSINFIRELPAADKFASGEQSAGDVLLANTGRRPARPNVFRGVSEGPCVELSIKPRIKASHGSTKKEVCTVLIVYWYV